MPPPVSAAPTETPCASSVPLDAMWTHQGLLPKNLPFKITFCIGAPRSGTTLLGSLLCEGSNCAPMLPECTFITQLIRHYHDIVNYADPQRFAAYAVSQQHLASIFATSVNEMMLTSASHFKALKFSQLVLKDPELTLYVDLIPLFFGTDCRVVCIVRDPRDVIASFVQVQMNQQEGVKEDELLALVFNYYWISHQSKLAADGGVHFVRFENIKEKNESEFVKLESFLGYPIGRKGFGKVFGELGNVGAFNTEHYGKPIASEPSSKRSRLLNSSFIDKIQNTFSGYNEIYQWWQPGQASHE